MRSPTRPDPALPRSGPLDSASPPLPAGRMPLSIRQLRFFVALSQTGNFSRAAEAMAVSQPALSAAIRQIETLLDTRLFDRTTHSVVPTQAGRALLPHAWRLLTTADNAFADMTSVLRNSRATVRIGAIPSALPATAQIVARIDEEAQGVNLHLADGTSDTLIAELRRGALDMAVCVASLIDEGLVSTPLIEDDMTLVLSRNHPLAGAPSLHWSALAGMEVVHFNSGSIGEISASAMRENNIVHSRRFRVDHMESLFGLARSGLAAGVMPRLYVRGHDPAALAVIPLVEPSIRRKVVLLAGAHLADEHPPAAAIAAHLAQVLPGALGAVV